MAILVTGGAGYIGSHIAICLLKSNYEVIIVDNFSNSQIDVIQRIQSISEKEVKVYVASITDEDMLEHVFSENHIDAVIHLASLKSVEESVMNPIDYYLNNLGGSLVLFEVMKKYAVKKIVFSSSATVYGENNLSPLCENLPVAPTNPYGHSKTFIEQVLKDIHSADREWSVCVLRYFNPIGAHESGLIGYDDLDTSLSLMSHVLKVALGLKSKLSIYGGDYSTADGSGIRDYVHVMDIAEGHLKALSNISKRDEFEVFNLGSGTGFSVIQLVKHFENITGIIIPFEILDRRNGDVAISISDISKATVNLNWKVRRNIDEMCLDSWNACLRKYSPSHKTMET